jgi:hypothetical protein
MAPASLHNNHEAARDTGVLVDDARRGSWLIVQQARPLAVPSCSWDSDYSMPKAGTMPVDDQLPSLLVSSTSQQPTTPS